MPNPDAGLANVCSKGAPGNRPLPDLPVIVHDAMWCQRLGLHEVSIDTQTSLCKLNNSNNKEIANDKLKNKENVRTLGPGQYI